MPCPIRFGPLPRMITAGLLARARPRSPRRRTSSGTASSRRTRPRRCRPSCRPGGRPSACRTPRTTSSASPRISPICSSEKPCRLARRSRSAVELAARRDLGGDLVEQQQLVEEPRVDPRVPRGAPRRWRRRGSRPAPRAAGRRAASRPARSSAVLVERRPTPGASRRRRSALSSERSAFCSASVKLRPIAIASPTDFMCVVSVGSAPRELLEREPRHLDDDVVEARLEATPASRA